MGSGSSTAAGAAPTQLQPTPPAAPKPSGAASDGSSPKLAFSRKNTQDLSVRSASAAERCTAASVPTALTDPSAVPMRTSAAARSIATPAAWVGSMSGEHTVACTTSMQPAKSARSSPLGSPVTEVQPVEASQDSLLKPGPPAGLRLSNSAPPLQQQQQQPPGSASLQLNPLAANGRLGGTASVGGSQEYQQRERRESSISSPDDAPMRASQEDIAWASLQSQYRISDPQAVHLVPTAAAAIDDPVATANSSGFYRTSVGSGAGGKSVGARRRRSASITDGDDTEAERDSKGGRARRDVEEVLMMEELGLGEGPVGLAPRAGGLGGGAARRRASCVPSLPPILPKSTMGDLLAPLPGDAPPGSRDLRSHTSAVLRQATWSTPGMSSIQPAGMRSGRWSATGSSAFSAATSAFAASAAAATASGEQHESSASSSPSGKAAPGPWSMGRMDSSKTLGCTADSDPHGGKRPPGRLPPLGSTLSTAASLSKPHTPVPEHELFIVEEARADVAQMSSLYYSTSINGSSTRSSIKGGHHHDLDEDVDSMIHAEAVKHGVSFRRRASLVRRESLQSRRTDSSAASGASAATSAAVSAYSNRRCSAPSNVVVH